MHCIVVGAGIIGVTVALRLVQRGTSVTLLDRAVPGAGTTGTTFAWVNASSKEPHDYFALNAAGMAAHARLAAEFGDASWLVPTGSLEWETSVVGQERLAARGRQLSDWGYPVQFLTYRQVERLEPDLRWGPEVGDVLFYPDESFVFPSLYLANLLRAARARGTALRLGEEVMEVVVEGGRVSGVRLRSGERLAADLVICCAGRWTPDILHSAGADLPLISPLPAGSEAVGLLVRTAPVAADVRRVLHPPDLAMRPDGGGRLLLQSDLRDREMAFDLPMSPPPPAAHRLLAMASPLVPALRHPAIETATIGIRPIPADGFSAVGWMAGIEGLYVMVTHSGVTLAPILAELAVREVHGLSEALLAPFRPDRFTA